MYLPFRLAGESHGEYHTSDNPLSASAIRDLPFCLAAEMG
jgi:hypothetical protein